MKSKLRNTASNSKHIDIELFYSQISNKYIKKIQSALTTTYGYLLDVIIGEELDLFEEGYNSKWDQYNADILLSYLLKIKKTETALWVIEKDLYCKNMNFIFGYAMYHKGAVLSIYRLINIELIEKEAKHEVGHILGLQHCSNRCVMQFSNSLWEAKMKPLYLCEKCKRKINLMIPY